MIRTPARAALLRGTDLLQAWLDVGALSGLHRSTLTLPPEQDRVLVGARRVVEVRPDELRLQVDLRWQARHRSRLEEWRGDLLWRVGWSVGPEGLCLHDPEPLEETHATLYAWGAAAARMDFAVALVTALTEAWSAPIPLDRGCVALELGDSAAITLTVSSAAVRGVAVAKKDQWTTQGASVSEAGVSATRPVALALPLPAEVRAGQVRLSLESHAARVDAWHDEVYAVRLELVPAKVTARELTLVGGARAVRERRARPVQLLDVVRGASGVIDGLLVRDDQGQAVTLPLARARAAAASRMFGPAIPSPGVVLADAEHASFVTWGLLVPRGGAA